MNQKKIPLRKCTGCQEMKNKKELIRIVRSDDGIYSIDSVGKKSGRGAYICSNIDCLERAKKTKGLERSFKSSIPDEVYDQLRNELNNNAI